jgi:Flp pilus assembly pilin Flp
MVTGLSSRSARDDGQALIEYALIVSLIAIVGIVALRLTGTNLTSLLSKIAGDV